MIAKARQLMSRMVPGRMDYELSSPDDEVRSSRREKSSKIVDGFDSDEQAVHTMRRIWEEGRTRMYTKLQRWERNLLFFQGKHWAIFPDTVAINSLDDLYNVSYPDNSDAETRTTANLIRKHVLGYVSRMTRNMPRVSWMPFSTDEDDKDRADVLNKISQAEAARNSERRMIVKAFLIASVCRSVFLKSCWDPQGGDLVHPLQDLGDGDLEMLRDPKVGPQVFGDDYEDMSALAERGVTDEDMEPEGAIRSEAVPPWCITFINPHDTEFRDVPSVMESNIRTLAWVKARYPDLDYDKITTLDGDGGWAHQLHFLQKTNEDLISQLSGNEGEGDGESGEPLDTFQLVLVHEYWARPTPNRKRGLHCVIAGGLVAERGDNPYWHQELPYTHYTHTLDPRDVFGNCDFDDAVEVQHQINQTLSHIIENRNLAANPKVLDNQSGVEWENTMNVPGEVLFNKNGYKPEYMQPPALPAYIGNMVPELRFILQELFDDHTPTQGVSRAGDSGVKTRLLQVAGEVRLATSAELFAEAYTEHWIQRVCLFAQYQERRKTGYAMGDMYDRSYYSWDRTTLVGSAARSELDVFGDEGAGRAMVLGLKQRLDCQVTVQPGKSIATVREDISNLSQLGLLDPVRHAGKIFEMYGYNFEAQEIMAQERQHASKAAMENDLLERGNQIAPPGVRERHDIHIEVHTRFINSLRFEKLDPMTQAAMHAHVELHEIGIAQQPIRDAYIQQMAQAMMIQQYGMLAVPPAAPAPGQPGQSGQNGAGGPPPSGPTQ